MADYEDAYSALKAAVDALGGAKRVGPRLRPECHDARGWLLNCLNPEHQQKLDPEQVFLLLRWACDAGFHDAKHYFDTVTGYTQGTPLALEVQLMAALKEAQHAQRLAEEKARDLQTLADNPRLLALMQHANVKVEP